MGLLEGRVALVTGGARGIGRAVAARFVEEGASVVLADVAGDEAARAASALTGGTDGSAGTGTAVGVAADVTDPESLAAAFDEAERRLGLVDVVVANAGILHLQPAVDLPPAAFRRVLEVNLTGVFLTCTEGARRLQAAGRGGRIVVSSSLFGLRGGVENAAYSASKFGCIGLVQCLAAELGGDGITVNAVCPGQVDTQMMRDLIRERSALRGIPEAEVEQTLVGRIPAGRLAAVTEVADAYVWLASDRAGYVTGQSITVDGGWLLG